MVKDEKMNGRIVRIGMNTEKNTVAGQPSGCAPPPDTGPGTPKVVAKAPARKPQ
jgi:hypothetical protein